MWLSGVMRWTAKDLRFFHKPQPPVCSIREGRLDMKNIVAKLTYSIPCLKEELFLRNGLGIKNRTELVLLVTVSVGTKSVYGMSDLNYTEAVVIALILLNEGEKSGYHRYTKILMPNSNLIINMLKKRLKMANTIQKC